MFRGDRRRTWRRTQLKYPDAVFYAKTVAPNPNPEYVTHVFSMPLDKGGPRYWAFDTKASRAYFVRLYTNAEECESPL